MNSSLGCCTSRLSLVSACALLVACAAFLASCTEVDLGTAETPQPEEGTGGTTTHGPTSPPPSSTTVGSPPQSACTATCAEMRNPCGRVLDPCGGQLVCDTCPTGQRCGGGGFNQCGEEECIPVTCESAGATCGQISDGCGTIVECGGCPSGQPCVENSCVCTPTTCAAAGATCGQISDGCGAILECGTCEPGLACLQGTCSCPAKTCASAGASCGQISDGCGATLDCGGCAGGQACLNNTCCASSDTCGNNVDDDCDGQVDEGCVFTCEAVTGNNCNADNGDGDQCDPSDNTNGCDPDRFWAWCNRSNDAYPDIWDDYLRNWVDDQCDGTISLEDPNHDGYPTFTCRDSNGRTWTCTTPLVLAFDAAEAVRYVEVPPGFLLDPAARLVSRAWPQASNPWLALDRNGNGSIDDGSELFGSATPLSTGRAAHHGFEPLAELDTDGDGFLDRSDAGWSQLLVWRDTDGNGVSSPDELSSAAQEGLLSLSVRPYADPQCDSLGRCTRERAEFRWLDAKGQLGAGLIIDVYLPSETAP